MAFEVYLKYPVQLIRYRRQDQKLYRVHLKIDVAAQRAKTN